MKFRLHIPITSKPILRVNAPSIKNESEKFFNKDILSIFSQILFMKWIEKALFLQIDNVDEVIKGL